MIRSTDAAFLNRVVNDPSVFPYVSLGLEGPFDLSGILSDWNNHFMCNEYGGFLFIKHKEYIYEVHAQFLPEGRGRSAIESALLAERYMFTKTDALRLDTYVAHDNRAASWFTRKVGFTKWGDVTVNGVPSHYYVLTLKNWARSLECQ